MPLAQLCPFAAWRPLGTQTEPLITPRIMVFHTMVGTLRGTDSYFRTGNGTGYGGTESHFGVGGAADGDLDGALWQWQTTDRQADAQAGGNDYCVSVETSDGGKPETPWSAKQVATLVRLGTWFCVGTGAPPQLVTSTSGRGFGYHRQFSVWNPYGKTCPGDTRVGQLKTVVIPRIQEALVALTSTDIKAVADAVLDSPLDPANPAWTLRSVVTGAYKNTAQLGAELDALATKVDNLAAAAGVDPAALAAQVADLLAERLRS